MIDLFGTRRIAQLQEALVTLSKQAARLEQERDAAIHEANKWLRERDDIRAERDRLNAAYLKLSIERDNLVAQLADREEALARLEAQYSVKKPRRGKVQVSLEAAPQEQIE